MNTIQEKYFETINGLKIHSSVLASANTVEILIENHLYLVERRRIIRHILCIILSGLVFNILIQQHSTLIVLNSIILTIIAIKCYVLINLIRFGKQFKCNFLLWSTTQDGMEILVFWNVYRKITNHQRFELAIHHSIQFWQKAYLSAHRVYSWHCHEWGHLWSKF